MVLPQVRRSWYDLTHDHGYWSPSTSTANFCEEDYIVSHYIAEFINTASNLSYLYYALNPPSALCSFLGTRGQGTHGNLSSRHVETGRTIWDIHTISLILVGIASGAFHMTLHVLPQWCDETSMYLLAGSWIYALLTTKYIPLSSSTIRKMDEPETTYHIVHHGQVLVGSVLVALLASASLSSFWTGHLDIHSIMFAALLVVSGAKLIYLIFLSTMDGTGWLGMSAARRTLLLALLRAIALLVLAFTIWLLDCKPAICPQLRYLRNEVLGQVWYLRPLVFLTELHGWWHILTARAAGEYMMLVRVLTTT